MRNQMKSQYISDRNMRNYREKAHAERSRAFHTSMRVIGQSVKFLFSQPERVIAASGKKVSRIQKTGSTEPTGSGVITVN